MVGLARWENAVTHKNALLWSQDGRLGAGGDGVATPNAARGGRGGTEHRGRRPRGAGHGHAVRHARRPSGWRLPRVAGGTGAPAPRDVALEHLRGKQGKHFISTGCCKSFSLVSLTCYAAITCTGSESITPIFYRHLCL